MSIIGDVCKELLGMFLADVRLTKAILSLVAIVAGIVVELRIERFPSWLSRDSHRSGPSAKLRSAVTKAIRERR